MTERARRAAAQIAAHQVLVLEQVRDQVTGADWVLLLHEAAEVERAAAVVRHPHDTPQVCRRRRLVARSAADAAQRARAASAWRARAAV
jgi:hypothetical protein